MGFFQNINAELSEKDKINIIIDLLLEINELSGNDRELSEYLKYCTSNFEILNGYTGFSGKEQLIANHNKFYIWGYKSFSVDLNDRPLEFSFTLCYTGYGEGGTRQLMRLGNFRNKMYSRNYDVEFTSLSSGEGLDLLGENYDVLVGKLEKCKDWVLGEYKLEKCYKRYMKHLRKENKIREKNIKSIFG